MPMAKQEPALKLVSAKDVKVRPVKWLWPFLIPKGKITLLQGDPGDGKSTFMLTLAAYLTRGDPLPFTDYEEPPEPIKVIYQSTEDDYDDTIIPRFIQAGGNLDNLIFINEEVQHLTFEDSRLLQAIKQSGAKLVVLDPLSSYFGDGNINASNEVRPKFNALIQTARETDCAIVIVNHLNKMSGIGAKYRVPGSIDVVGAVRSILLLARSSEDEDKRYLALLKSNLAPEMGTYELQLSDNGMEFIGLTDKKADELLQSLDFSPGAGRPNDRLQEAIDFIEELLADGSAMLAVDIEKRLKDNGIRRSTAHKAKQELGVKSFSQNKKWYWQLPRAE